MTYSSYSYSLSWSYVIWYIQYVVIMKAWLGRECLITCVPRRRAEGDIQNQEKSLVHGCEIFPLGHAYLFCLALLGCGLAKSDNLFFSSLYRLIIKECRMEMFHITIAAFWFRWKPWDWFIILMRFDQSCDSRIPSRYWCWLNFGFKKSRTSDFFLFKLIGHCVPKSSF